MKKKLRLVTVGLCFFAVKVAAQIPNAGFETWNSMGSYENPDGWSTMNNKTSTQSMFTATKGTPGSPGNSYLKLTSKSIGGGVVTGIAVSGKLDTMSLTPVHGVPFTQRPASLTGKWQYMIYGTSEGSMMVLLTKWNATQNRRDTVAHAVKGMPGMVMAWANFSFNLAYKDSLNYPDSCMIVLRASGANPANNDYLWADNLAFTGTVAVVSQPTINTGVNKNSDENPGVTLFPNPSNGLLTVNYNLVSNDHPSIQIIDVSGKIVREIAPTTSQSGKNSVIIETNNIPKGIYSVVIRSANSTSSKKLLIE